jgi:hypothetical protein
VAVAALLRGPFASNLKLRTALCRCPAAAPGLRERLAVPKRL